MVNTPCIRAGQSAVALPFNCLYKKYACMDPTFDNYDATLPPITFYPDTTIPIQDQFTGGQFVYGWRHAQSMCMKRGCNDTQAINYLSSVCIFNALV